MDEEAKSAAYVLNRMAHLGEQFQRGYQSMLTDVLSLDLPTTLCTVYYPRFPDSFIQKAAVTALGVFNDVIIRAAFTAGLPLIDLRLLCDKEEDFANPIEPSDIGGEKIAGAIHRAITEHHFENRRTEVFWSSR